jgi:acyl carrier protein
MYEVIKNIIDSLRIDKTVHLNPETTLIGSNRVLDSLLLVELCLKLEDLASENSFVFDWTSSEAMSKSSSMFRDIGSLVSEFEKQLNSSK